ncbi:uncharacterized protein LOC142349152 [Convolutriloba macropyga]|uniref:uncharacterized protein LOC142349152 n=1 Tax=Convolutriloba macropyga TaxID=536237 RepID=UPI003F51ED50
MILTKSSIIILCLLATTCRATLSVHRPVRVSDSEPEYSMDFQLPNRRRVDRAFTCWKRSKHFCFLRLSYEERQSDFENDSGQRAAFEDLIRPVYSFINWFPLDKTSEGYKHFCFLRLSYEERQSDFENDSGQRAAFEDLIRPVYSFINWFPLDKTSEDCCKYQGKVFMDNGERYGLRAIVYIENIVWNIQRNDKVLTYVRAHYNGTSCLNVISEVGFGVRHQEVKMKGNPRNGAQFVLPLDGDYDIYKFEVNRLRGTLTFKWFKENVICKEQSWVCEMSPESVNAWLFAGVHTRWMYNYAAPAIGRFFGFGSSSGS